MLATKYYIAKGMKWVARLIGLGALVFFTLALLLSLMFRDPGGSDALTLASMGIGLVGLIVSWRREWLAGMLLLLASIPMGIGTTLSGLWRVGNIDWERLCLPLLGAGGLFLLSWWLSKNTTSSTSP